MAAFPANIKDLNFSKLTYPQIWVMGEWMGVLPRIRALKSNEQRSTFLREVCLANEAHAQIGYQMVCLQKSPVATKPSNDGEKRFLEMTASVINAHVGDIDLRVANEVKVRAAEAAGDFDKLAKKALADAAAKVVPLVIKDGAKLRKVKGVLPSEFKHIVELASARIPIMLVGPAGCGKTYLCEKLGEALGLPFSDQSCSEGMSESVFNGRLLPIGKAGAFEHVESPFMQRYEKGGVHLLDEMDAGDPNLFTYINKAIANSSYTADQRYKNPVVKKHKDFVLIAAANTFGNGADAMYVGRNQLDAATLDRFKIGMVTMDYSREVELSLASQELCEWAWRIRDKIRQNKLRRIMSTRVIKDLATMTELYEWKPEEWNKSYFSGWTTAEINLVRAA